MDFYLFILLNAVLFVRPADLFPALDGAPVYEGVILACLAVSAPQWARQLTARRLYDRPAVAAVLGLMAAVALSHLSHGRPADAAEWGFRFFKIAAFFLLLVGVVNTPDRLRRLVGWIGLLIVGMTGLVLLQHGGVIDLPSLAPIEQGEVDPETGERFTLPRLCGAGIFNDPNDLSVILVVGLVISLYRLRDSGPSRVFWAGSLGMLGYALTLTHSRGGFLALVAAVLSLVAGRLGARRAVLLGGPLVVGLGLVMAGRQTSFDLSNSDDTAQHRIRLWREGMVLLEQAPAFGIGAGRFEDEAGLVAHNSFVHAFAELGLLGGSLFLGAFVVPIVVLFRLGGAGRGTLGPTLRDLRPFVLACVAGTAGGMLSLSRVYTLTPYLVLGLATVFLGLTGPAAAARVPKLTPRLLAAVLGLSAVFLAALHLFVRAFAQSG
jgi:O-Antigen ligase